MTKKQKYNTEDNRGVSIYARKSRITNKGDSIGVQFKQCEEYAKRELNLDEDYTFLNTRTRDYPATIPTVLISSVCFTILKWARSVPSSATN